MPLAMLQVSVLVPRGVKKSNSAEHYNNLPKLITITYHSYLFVHQHRLLLCVLWCLVVMMSAITASVFITPLNLCIDYRHSHIPMHYLLV